MLAMTDCPSPFKHPFPSKGDAMAALRRHRSVPGSNVSNVYRCACGAWHLAGTKSTGYTHNRKRSHRVKKRRPPRRRIR